uniref:Uncharacterized protein n=1 Tax=Arundo donax TaxID=35708 RepID=A0A0A9D990_ARUDO
MNLIISSFIPGNSIKFSWSFEILEIHILRIPFLFHSNIQNRNLKSRKDFQDYIFYLALGMWP